MVKLLTVQKLLKVIFFDVVKLYSKACSKQILRSNLLNGWGD